ncbi:MAG: hypothetical protein IKL44_06320 [Clostridia bacterium]|nr:hypothetical protein [Clostridia bacterium]
METDNIIERLNSICQIQKIPPRNFAGFSNEEKIGIIFALDFETFYDVCKMYYLSIVDQVDGDICLSESQVIEKTKERYGECFFHLFGIDFFPFFICKKPNIKNPEYCTSKLMFREVERLNEIRKFNPFILNHSSEKVAKMCKMNLEAVKCYKDIVRMFNKINLYVLS